VYDMYPWNRPASAASPTGAASDRSSAAPAPESSRANEGARAAVQIALDRRDNGGDASGAAAAAGTA